MRIPAPPTRSTASIVSRSRKSGCYGGGRTRNAGTQVHAKTPGFGVQAPGAAQHGHASICASVSKAAKASRVTSTSAFSTKAEAGEVENAGSAEMNVEVQEGDRIEFDIVFVTSEVRAPSGRPVSRWAWLCWTILFSALLNAACSIWTGVLARAQPRLWLPRVNLVSAVLPKGDTRQRRCI